MQKTLLVILGAFSLVSARQINEAGLDLIKELEGFRTDFYVDAAVSLSRLKFHLKIIT
jgi:hypothetical protein